MLRLASFAGAIALTSLAGTALGQDDAPRPILTGEQGVNEIRLGTELLHATQRPVRELTGIQVPGSEVVVVRWIEDGPAGAVGFYRVRFEGRGFSRVRPVNPVLNLKRADFDPLAGAPSFEESGLEDSGSIHIVQFHTQSLAAYRAEIERLGGTVYHFLPHQAHLVRLPDAAVEVVAALDFVRWVGPYHAQYRLEQEILDNLDTGLLPVDQRYNVQVFEKGPAQKAVVAERIAALGGRVVAQIPDGYLLEAELSIDQVRVVATWDEVIWIDRWHAPENDMNKVRNDGGANMLEANTGFTGQGVRGECFDGNCFANHPDLQSNPVLFHGGHSGDAGHGTPVTGICFADGTNNAAARGLLPDGQPIFADNGQVPNRYTHTAELLAPPYEAVFQTNSWGSSLTTAYNSFSMQMDDILFDVDIVILQSQSNTGDQNSRPQAWAKNIVSVGGIVHNNTLDTSDDFWGNAGSIGAAQDGRIKPDLSYWYDSILTTAGDGNYTNFGGTSAATPITAGYFGLFFQMWHENVFGNDPQGATVFESRPKASLARAFMFNGAERYDFDGTTHDLTRVHQGWGRANVRNLYNGRKRMFFVDETDVLQNLESTTYSLVVPPEEDDLRVTMVYLDLPGTTSASQHRINDLTLRVSAPDGQQYWGNKGLRKGNWSTTANGADTKGTTENVFLQNPAPGTWTVEVFADEVNADSHVETPEVDADYALVVHGTTGEAGDCLKPTSYCDGAPNSVGDGAKFQTSGSTSVAANDMTFEVSEMPASQFGLFFYGDSTQDTPLGDGSICVGGTTVRLPAIQADGAGLATYPLDLTSLPPAGQISAGSTWYFQFWYRDTAAMGTGYNFSNARQIIWCD